MEEKESQEKLLEAETRIRLEKLRQRIPESSQSEAPKINSSTNVQTSKSKPVEEEKTKKNSVDAESRAKWAYKRFVEITK